MADFISLFISSKPCTPSDTSTPFIIAFSALFSRTSSTMSLQWKSTPAEHTFSTVKGGGLLHAPPALDAWKYTAFATSVQVRPSCDRPNLSSTCFTSASSASAPISVTALFNMSWSPLIPPNLSLIMQAARRAQSVSSSFLASPGTSSPSSPLLKTAPAISHTIFNTVSSPTRLSTSTSLESAIISHTRTPNLSPTSPTSSSMIIGSLRSSCVRSL
mmetsp:Transcript_2593/g.4900  ORF Transcript_2593/g.4900 Transcript_2593/m.4900 type:complete len:216 (+) Transcript_2593:243-890(+)